jgi:two-component system sensor histidine kinase/response regulator
MNIDASKKGTVLIVDDTPTNLELLFRHLTRSGYRVLVAKNGRIALSQAEQTRPDIILLDIMMPEMDGFETCERLKAMESTKDIPVIFMTALTDVDSKLRAFTIGAVDYVTKPFERREVLARIDTHLTVKRLQNNLESEIAERSKVEARLREAAADLQTQYEEMDAFAHTVAHNLKNPLHAVSGIAHLLAVDAATMPRDEIKKYLEVIARSSQKSLNIVDELLVLASVRHQEIDLQPLDMATIVNDARQRVAFMLEEYQADLKIPDLWNHARGYGPWVEEVWVNYISNALKYGGEPPVVELGSTQEGDMVRFWVKDNGSGIPKDAQQKLFTPFTQINKVSVTGHGLGLSIVSRIVHKLNGDVAIESQGLPGQGSIFSFTLPQYPQRMFAKADNEPASWPHNASDTSRNPSSVGPRRIITPDNEPTTPAQPLRQ